jgi:2'-5' RNA ligase
VAILLPGRVRAVLGRCVEQLVKRVPAGSVRWVRTDDIHLTLRFLGNVPFAEVDSIKSALSASVQGRRAFGIHVGRPGCFPNPESPRVLWIGLEGALGSLADLQAGVQEATRAWGDVEAREFHPHLTLGRVNTRRKPELRLIRQALERCEVGESPEWQVEAIHLMESVPSPAASRYTALAGVPLAV